ncbi:MAG: HAMP domain-containing protein [Rothia sp. (in: high G+C Gram-positive bacteria)]|nr:HAMP domain-containing protein [Rothia sp. (in: high G+C Gram-positive bacteria)]
MTNPLRKLHPKHRRAHPSGTQGQRTGSVRLRIVAWMVLVTAFIITGLIFTVREILISEVGSNAAASAESEISEFRNFAEIGVDPTTAAPFEDLNQLLTAFVSRQYTGHSEQLIGITPQQVIFIDEQEQFSDNSGYRLHHDRDLLTTITSNNRTSGIAQTPAGPVHWGTVEINLNTDTGAHTGHLIVVEYIQPELDEVQHTIITMIWVGLGGLAATILIAWLVAGRITKPIRSLRTVAQEINDKNFSGRVAVKGDDDVAAMGHTFKPDARPTRGISHDRTPIYGRRQPRTAHPHHHRPRPP